MKSILLVVLLCSIGFIFTKEIYISESRGDDNNSGSISHPFKTLKKAFTTAENDDVIKVEEGTYTTEGVLYASTSFKLTGLKSKNGKKPRITGRIGFSYTKTVFITGFEFANSGTGITILTGVQTYSVEDCDFFNMRGFFFFFF